LTDCERAVGDAILNQYLDWHAIAGFATGAGWICKEKHSPPISAIQCLQLTWQLTACMTSQKAKGYHHNLSRRKPCVGGRFARIRLEKMKRLQAFSSSHNGKG